MKPNLDLQLLLKTGTAAKMESSYLSLYGRYCGLFNGVPKASADGNVMALVTSKTILLVPFFFIIYHVYIRCYKYMHGGSN